MLRGEELSFAVDLQSLSAEPMRPITLSEAGIKERGDLQRWIEDNPEIVEPDLLVITTEFDQWQLRERRVADRLDILFLDSKGSLLVAELKRDEAPDTTDLQVLKYAAYCSQLTVDDVVEQLGRYRNLELDEARSQVLDHAPSLADRELGAIRAKIVAGSFGPSVTHTVLFLNDLGLDIGCIQVSAVTDSAGRVVLSSRQILPPPAAEDYLVKRRRKEEKEMDRDAETRRRNSVTVLDELGAFEPGTQLRINLGAFSAEQREAIEAKVTEDPTFGICEWTGLGLRRAARWNYDGELYSFSGLTDTLLRQVGFNPGSLAGPDYWLAPSGRNLYHEAVYLESPELEDGASELSADE